MLCAPASPCPNSLSTPLFFPALRPNMDQFWSQKKNAVGGRNSRKPHPHTDPARLQHAAPVQARRVDAGAGGAEEPGGAQQAAVRASRGRRSGRGGRAAQERWAPTARECAEACATGARAGPAGCLCSRGMPEAQALPVAGAGAEPDAHRSDNGFTALIAAAVKGHDKVAERLLAAGAELDQQTKVRLARADDSERLPVRRLARAPRARSPLLLRVRRPDRRS